MIKEARVQIYAVGSEVFDPFYFVEAAQEAPAPYGVITPFSMPTNRDTGKQYEEIYFQYLVYYNDLSAAEATKAQLDAAFKDISNYNFDSYRVVGLIQMSHIVPAFFDGLWAVGSQFKLEIEPN